MGDLDKGARRCACRRRQRHDQGRRVRAPIYDEQVNADKDVSVTGRDHPVVNGQISESGHGRY